MVESCPTFFEVAAKTVLNDLFHDAIKSTEVIFSGVDYWAEQSLCSCGFHISAPIRSGAYQPWVFFLLLSILDPHHLCFEQQGAGDKITGCASSYSSNGRALFTSLSSRFKQSNFSARKRSPHALNGSSKPSRHHKNNSFSNDIYHSYLSVWIKALKCLLLVKKRKSFHKVHCCWPCHSKAATLLPTIFQNQP